MKTTLFKSLSKSIIFLTLFAFGSWYSTAQTPLFPNDPMRTLCSGEPFWVGNHEGDPSEQFLNLHAAWAITTGNPNIKVAILSTGTDWNQQDMPVNNQLGYNFVDGNNNTSASCTYYATKGTMVNSIICSKTNNGLGVFGIAGGWGSAPGVTPVIYKCANGVSTWNTCSSLDIPNMISSINAAVAAGAKVILIPHCIFGPTAAEQQTFIDAVQAILSNPCNQVTFIAAAGDWDPQPSSSHDVYFPGTYDPIITVGGAGSDHKIYTNAYNSSGSCYGNHLDFVTSYSSPANDGDPCLSGNSPYYCDHSTSISAAQLAGVVALMYSVNPNLSQTDVFEILKQSCYKATDIYSFNADGWNEKVGYGFPNAKTAIDLAMNYTGGEPPISSIVTWTSPSNITKGNITIRNGGVLILSGITLSMTPGATITIEPGGKLIANNSLITNACPMQYWNGINVWGNKSANQFPDINGNYQQGYLELNGSTIMNSICAANLWKPNDYSKTGGILKATNSTFRNNKCAIHAGYYKNTDPRPPYTAEMDYRGTVQNCLFEITTDYIPTQTFYKHVDLASIKGFSFIGSDFALAPNVAGVSEWNQAIASYSAGFHLKGICNSGNIGPCTSYNTCKFTGFRYGINANNLALNNYTFDVNRAEFENNSFGINVLQVNSEIILNSIFKVGYNPSPGCPTESGYGIHLENSTGFAIEENTFTKLINAPVSTYTGIYVKNTNAMDDIYKNSFSGLSFGNYAVGLNHTPGDGNFGLEYLCNTNQSNWADFYNPPPPDVANDIQSFQGNPQIAAGNTFSQTNNRWHFYNGGGYGLTYHYSGNAPYDPDPNNDQYELYNVSRSLSNSANQCLSHYGGTISSIVLNNQERSLCEQKFAYNLINYNNVKTLHDDLRDGGSTQERINSIETAKPEDMWALRTELLGVSPHLSEEVLRKVADKTDVFSESVIFDILAANPDELKKEELLKYLEDKENPLPGYMIEILRQVAAGETYRTVLEKQMADYRKEMTRAANDMIRSILNDSVIDLNYLRGWLDNLGGISADKQIIASYLQEENFQAALALANMLPSLYHLTGKNLDEHLQYIQLINLYQALNTENRQMDQLTISEKEMLQEFANISSGYAGAAAKAILTNYYNAHFVDCLQTIEPESLKKGDISVEAISKIYGMQISVKPNPATEWVAFDYSLPEFESSATIQITDMAGKTIEYINVEGKKGQKVWDTRNIKTGVYIYTMKSGNKLLSGKVTITK